MSSTASTSCRSARRPPRCARLRPWPRRAVGVTRRDVGDRDVRVPTASTLLLAANCESPGRGRSRVLAQRARRVGSLFCHGQATLAASPRRGRAAGRDARRAAGANGARGAPGACRGRRRSRRSGCGSTRCSRARACARSRPRGSPARGRTRARASEVHEPLSAGFEGRAGAGPARGAAAPDAHVMIVGHEPDFSRG